MTVKLFDMEAAKKGALVQTRGGDPVRIICFDRKVDDYPIVALIKHPGGYEEAFSYDDKGRFSKLVGAHRMDLVMAPQKRSYWINCYREWVSSPCPTKERADYIAGEGRIARLEVVWEE